MPTALSNYHVMCLTEGIKVLSEYRSAPPTSCPNDTNHVIDENKIVKYKTLGSNETTIVDQIDGAYQISTIVFNIENNSGLFIDSIIWQSEIIIWSITIYLKETLAEDSFDLIISPDKTIGFCLADINEKNSVFEVSPTVIKYVKRGYDISITDGENNNDLGRVLSVDELKNVITTEYMTTNNFKAGAMIQLNYKIIRDFHIDTFNISPLGINMGQRVFTGKTIPANSVIKLVYKNNNNQTSKKIIVKLEYSIIS